MVYNVQVFVFLNYYLFSTNIKIIFKYLNHQVVISLSGS